MKQRTDVDTFIARKVSELREGTGLTQTAAARLSGVHQPTYAKIEKYGHPASFKSLYRIAKAFGVTFHDLVPAESADLTKDVRRRSATEENDALEIKELARACAERQLKAGVDAQAVQPGEDDWADFEALVSDSKDDFAMTVFIREMRQHAVSQAA